MLKLRKHIDSSKKRCIGQERNDLRRLIVLIILVLFISSVLSTGNDVMPNYSTPSNQTYTWTVGLKGGFSQLPPHVRNCIWKLEVLMAEVLLKMLRNTEAEDEGKEGLAEKFARCENLPEEISEVVSEIRPTVENNAAEVQRGWQQICALEKQKEKLKVFCRNSMLKHTKEIETKMSTDRKASEKKQEVIVSAVHEIKNKHERTRVENLKKEKDLRNERNKIDEKLKEIINQYNQDMKRKEIILDKLVCSYEKETATLNELTEVFEEQKARYDELMQEKADYERSVWDDKLYEVQKKIAARKIQRFYRSYLAIMLAHGKRGKRGRGKKRK